MIFALVMALLVWDIFGGDGKHFGESENDSRNYSYLVECLRGHGGAGHVGVGVMHEAHEGLRSGRGRLCGEGEEVPFEP